MLLLVLYFLEALERQACHFIWMFGIYSDVICNGENAMISKIGDSNIFQNIERVNNDNKLYSKLSSGAKNLFH